MIDGVQKRIQVIINPIKSCCTYTTHNNMIDGVQKRIQVIIKSCCSVGYLLLLNAGVKRVIFWIFCVHVVSFGVIMSLSLTQINGNNLEIRI